MQTLTELAARSTTPTRMVAVDVWGDHPPVHAGALYRGVDAVAETDYTGWYDIAAGLAPPGSSAAMRARLRAQERTFAGKVLMISEFGAESNTLNRPGAPGSYGFQASLLARHIAVYAADPKLSGMLVWDLRDYPLVPELRGRLDPLQAALAAADRRHQPEGPVHVRRPGQAGRRSRRATVQGAAEGLTSGPEGGRRRRDGGADGGADRLRGGQKDRPEGRTGGRGDGRTGGRGASVVYVAFL